MIGVLSGHRLQRFFPRHAPPGADRMESPRSSAPSVSSERSGPLGVWDAASIIVGIVVGTVIFKSGPLIFGGCGGPMGALLAWVVGGVFAFIGAMCYAELATSYPRSG